MVFSGLAFGIDMIFGFNHQCLAVSSIVIEDGPGFGDSRAPLFRRCSLPRMGSCLAHGHPYLNS